MSLETPNPEIPTKYDATVVESAWYLRWEQAGLFQPSGDPAKPVYSVTIPPPNVTGSLHMGHALCYPLQDLLGRYKRMQGYDVLVLPGTDHAGIATQGVVTKLLKKEGSSPSHLGREAFVERVKEWKEESGGTILRQFRALGCAFDWSRERYTLDDHYHDAVLKVFVEWFERGVIYRGLRVVNWDPVLKTTVSDIETERRVTKGKLYHVRYPFTDGTGEVVVATTRPETMLADVAVAVHPSDDRYKGLVGKTLTLPLVGREIPLLADTYPDPEFGTGAVKITPGHDPNDFEVGQRHGLEVLIVMDDSARINDLGGPYAGLDRYEARKRVVADLEEQGFLVKVEDHEIALIVSERSGEVIEPVASEQWFAKMAPLAGPVIEAVESGRVKFFPERYTEIFLEWMRNVRDWNVSRQLWWGHRVPVYYDEQDRPYAAMSWDEAQQKAGTAKIVRQDPDVLDTWFSSGMWPFVTLGWPDSTPDLDRYYPTSVLVTSREIIYLWVARMMMMGLDFKGDIPFHEVYIYATVLTEDGKRMSKSLGTGVDPLDIIETKGADALRFTLFSQTGLNQDIRYSERRTTDARNFCNKIWNASRFVMLNLEGYRPERPEGLEAVDRWLLSRLAATEVAVREGYEGYDVQASVQALYKFFWSELCDWYIEIAKSRLTDPARRAAPQWLLVECLSAFLRMLHPVMPHITEEVYTHLPIQDKAPFVMASSWPEIGGDWRDLAVEGQVDGWLEATRAVRALRAELGLDPGRAIAEAFYEGDLHGGDDVVRGQAWLERLTPGRPDGKAISQSVGSVTVYLPTQGLVDEAEYRAKLDKDIAARQAELSKLQSRLDDPVFVERAKPEIVAELREQVAEKTLALSRQEDVRSMFA